MAKNILMHQWDKDKNDFEEIHPVTRASNVLDENGDPFEKHIKDLFTQYGIGEPKEIKNFDSLDSGFYYANPGATNAPTSSGDFVVFVARKSSNEGSQIAVERFNGQKSKVYVRSEYFGSYSRWEELVGSDIEVSISEINDLRVNDKGELEFYDGKNWKKANYVYVPTDTSGAPGPVKGIAGDTKEGFFGEVSTSKLITGDELSSKLGLTAGSSQFSTEPWLKFYYENTIEFVAKKPFRYNLSWDDINAVNAVQGTNVTINGQTYKVRLMEGANEDPASSSSGQVNHHSEWNRLMLQIHENSINENWSFPDNVENDIGSWNHSLGSGKQGMYTDDDLRVGSGNGRRSWCQEVAESGSYRIVRGYTGVSNSNSGASHISSSYGGFRPVLEMV